MLMQCQSSVNRIVHGVSIEYQLKVDQLLIEGQSKGIERRYQLTLDHGHDVHDDDLYSWFGRLVTGCFAIHSVRQ